jgi:hemerythrin-like domain-containing protein
MKRDQALHGLSSDHHSGLLLARTIRRALERGGARCEQAIAAVRTYERSLQRHFETEETALLPALDRCGEAEIVQRLRAEHALLRELQSAILETSSLNALASFGELLEAHIRFEERTVFQVAQAKLSRAELDEIAARAPAPSA